MAELSCGSPCIISDVIKPVAPEFATPGVFGSSGLMFAELSPDDEGDESGQRVSRAKSGLRTWGEPSCVNNEVPERRISSAARNCLRASCAMGAPPTYTDGTRALPFELAIERGVP